MNIIQAFWCKVVKPLKILFWVIVGIVVIGVILAAILSWLAVKS